MPSSASAVPAGWHPGGQPGQRDHDEQRRRPPTFNAPTSVAIGASAGREPNNALHAVLTIFTFGLWLPVWIMTAFLSAGTSPSAVAGGPGDTIATAGSRKFIPLMVVGALMLTGTVAKQPGLLMVLLMVATVGGGAVWSMKTGHHDRKAMAAVRSSRIR